jgi:glycosyltransferase involved in cell wall biosynthesis
MRIAVIQETDWSRRGPHQQHHLFERLSLRGHEIIVLDYPILRPHWPREPFITPPRDCSNAARIYDGAQIRLITPGTLSPAILARPSSLITHWRTLGNLIHEKPPALIVSYALSTGLPALTLARRHNIPFVLHVIDALHTIVPNKWLQPIAHFVERRLYSAADAVILINDHLRDYALCMGASGTRARVLRTGVDLEHFSPNRAPETVRREMGIGETDLVLLFMGWLYPFSGLVEVAQSLTQAPEGVRLVVVGDGDLDHKLQELKQSTLGERLILTGRVPYQRIPDFVAAADVCLLPFHTIPATEHIVPIKLYEYMAAGKPVIAAPLPGVRRDVGDHNGVRFAPAAEQIACALEIRAEAPLLGAQARRFVEANCDWNIITDEFETLLMHYADKRR